VDDAFFFHPVEEYFCRVESYGDGEAELDVLEEEDLEFFRESDGFPVRILPHPNQRKPLPALG